MCRRSERRPRPGSGHNRFAVGFRRAETSNCVRYRNSGSAGERRKRTSSLARVPRPDGRGIVDRGSRETRRGSYRFRWARSRGRARPPRSRAMRAVARASARWEMPRRTRREPSRRAPPVLISTPTADPVRSMRPIRIHSRPLCRERRMIPNRRTGCLRVQLLERWVHLFLLESRPASRRTATLFFLARAAALTLRRSRPRGLPRGWSSCSGSPGQAGEAHSSAPAAGPFSLRPYGPRMLPARLASLVRSSVARDACPRVRSAGAASA